jgi:putative hydrolase of the HAD superfamily
MLILFDIDDTLLDSTSASRAAAAALHARAGVELPLDEFLSAWSGASDRVYARYLSGDIDFQEQRRVRIREVVDGSLGDAAADELFALYEHAFEAAWALFPDASECFAALAGHRLGVVSNGQSKQQRRKLDALGITQRFAGIVISGDIGVRKPAPEIFLHACTLMDASPHDALYVGDRYDIDALGARGAGLVGVWLDRTRARLPGHEPPIISTLADLPAVLEGRAPAWRLQRGADHG